ncbi:Kinesin-like protein KIF27 [Termitomyces sp. T112]|nr:Kinesin-like protein KIF27 [Termitomyces sp. T112]
MTTSVKVALRIRPPTNQDSTSIPARFQRSVIHATSSNTVSIEAASISGSGSGTLSTPSTPSSGSVAKKQQFSFDQVHPPNTAQYDLFVSTAKPLVSRFIEGFNCTILAYGQTSSGKTFTMTGIDLDADPADPNNGMGIVPRAVSTIFSSAKQLKEERGSTWTYSVKGSFIEIYNEDLIDLLSLDDMAGGRRDVQIREDKDGHIIWGGLREVNVRNVAEVMSLLRKGTSIRRTNETDMNAQSSRSHAIFSLTLTQKKYTGSTPPRSSTPLSPSGRSPSRLARPGSMIASPSATRVASPTFGRPSTPSFAAAMGRGGLRPSSALGHVGERLSHAGGDDEYGEWVTIVSKFHFVDLAGSERLKRTAAAGERIKEGISINSGLLALGNVISALGDPSRSKSHTASHIPYRDSKLTRLLQDSLGGNAHTLMIACVSPAEWNANETLNTLKYANRARNIKNRAVLNEKEDGWDDVEWLQGTVTRLRKELKTIKEGGVVVTDSSSSGVVDSSASKKVLAQMTELQNNYEEMRSTFVERTEELTRLRRELGEKQRISTAGAVGATARYEEIVGPVIEEYEKTIATMEAELSLNKAALRHTNELFEEKEEELTVLTERHAATELYVEELRNRVVKLTERETSTEAYVRDLEDKIKSYDETSITSSESLTDLKREIARFKEAETSSAQYIADLEARLGRSDESVLSLQRIVERLENECDRRQDEVKSLNSRLEALREDGNNWRSDLEERERKVKELETRMAEWEAKKKEAYDVRTRLGGVVDEVASAKKNLEINVANTPQTSEGVTSNPPAEQLAEVLTQPSIPGSALEKQLLALQQTHTATLADLSAITAKYRDALREISDLAAQIQEAKLNNPESAQSESPEKLVESPPVRRRMPSGRVKDAEPQYNSAGRRLFFRQAASTESLHARSLSQSQSLSQELSSVHSRKASFSSHGTSSSHSPSNSQSTLNYLSGVQNLSTSLPSSSSFNGSERSVHSLEHEIMRLQEVLKEREAEITLLEESLKESQEGKSSMSSTIPIAVGPLLQPSGSNGTAAATLSPKTLNQFDHIRKTMENGSYAHTDTGSEVNSVSVLSEADESLERLNELMLSMAQKESHHREVVDSLNNQLSQVQRQLDDLTTLSRDQALNMSTEIEGLRKKHDQHLEKLEEAESRASALSEALKKAEADYENEIDELRRRHQAILDAKLTDFDDTLARTKQDHSTSLSRLRDELKVASAVLEQSRRNHEQELGKLKANYSEELRLRLQEAHNTIDLMRDEHSKAMNRLLADHTEQLKQKDAETDAVLQRTEEEYYNALTKLREAHADTLVERAAESNANLERLREEHAAALQMREIARQGSLSESESSQARALKELQDAHAEAIVRKEVFFAEESQALKADHARTLAMKTDDFALHMDRLRLEYETTLAKLKEEHRMEVNSLHSAVAEAKADLVTASLKGSKDKDQAIFAFKEQQTLVLQGLQHSHDDQLTALKATHEATLQKARDEFEEERLRVTQSQADKIAKLEAQHQKDLDDVKITIGVLKDEHRLAIETLREQNERVLGEETNRLSTDLSSLKEEYHATLETLREQNRVLADEKDSLLKSFDNLQAEHRATLETSQTHIETETRVSESFAALQEEHREHLQVVVAQAESLGREKDHLSKSLAVIQDEHRESLKAMQSEARQLTEEKNNLSNRLEALQDDQAKSLDNFRSQVEFLEQEKARLSETIAVLERKHCENLEAAESRVDLLASEKQHLLDILATRQAEHHVSLQVAKTQAEQLAEEKKRLEDNVASLQSEHQETLQAAKSQIQLLEEKDRISASLVRDLESLRAEHDLVLQELDSHKVAADEFTLVREQARHQHEQEMEKKGILLRNIENQLSGVVGERNDLKAEVARLQEKLNKTRGEQSKLIQEASQRESFVGQSEQYRSALTELQENLQKVQEEKDAIQMERSRAENLVRELQAQLARSASPPHSRPAPERNLSYTRATGLPAMKLPPPTPPPSIPPPPAPTPRVPASASVDASLSISSNSSTTVASTSSRESQLESPLTSVPTTSPPPTDPKIFVQIEQQAKQINEQVTMINTLNKQLTHCESDLQAHMDLVSTLETSLSESEKNLRKARMHATEIARERDTLNAKLETVRNELAEAKREVVTVRRSIVEEKQSLEQKLDEERKAKERARSQLDSRMDEIQRRKSKFACL